MSRKLLRPLLFLAAAAIVLPAFAQVSQKKIATLGPGEEIVVQESLLLAGAGPGCGRDDYFIVSRTTGGAAQRFFVYDKNGRKGPYEKISDSMLRTGAGFEPRPAHYSSDPTIEGIEETPDHGLSFRGKTYGPFQQVLSLAVSEDKARFYGLAVKAGQLRFFSSDGRDVAAGGMPVEIKLSPDGMKAVAVCRGALTLYEGVKIDPAKMDPTSFDDVYLYPIDGPKLGPFHKDQEFGDVWFAAGSQNWLFDLGPTVYFNGAPLRKFPNPVDKATFWIDDAKRFAWVYGEEINFSDGAKYPYPLMIRHEKAAGKTTLCWIALQKNGDVIAYQRSL